ncbi:MAG: DegT/DnrJ/EryC1/StrS family aminotransferase [Candidatus Bathyarchaeota archaeon]|nr:DegT/DnrJ/EryC1/StrS family aminotransferase [Candidatus Bathyarchaeota archaeon]
MNKELIRSSRPLFPKNDIDQVLRGIQEVLESGQFRNGKNVAVFERMVAQYVGVNSAVAFDSDSSAFETALRYFGIDGGEVVVCTNSFISVPNSVVAAGGKVVFADINADTLSMDSVSLRQNITAKTRGIIITHIAGFPNPELKEIMEVCSKHDLFILEDATHAIGASVNGRKVGTFGDAAIFAFTPTKVITTGEGGMLVTNDAELAEFSKLYSFYGSGPGKTNFVNLGRHMVLPELSAVLGIHQLKRLEEFITRRNEIAEIYDETLNKMGAMRTIVCPVGYRSSYYKYPLILDPEVNKAEFTRRLLEEFAVETGNIFYPPCHLQGVYKKVGACTYGSLSTAEEVLSRTITLPMHAALSNEEINRVLDAMSQLAKT